MGNKKAIDQLEDAILSSKVALVNGPAGVGKTTSVYVLSSQIGFQVREWNASDSRKKEDIINIYRELKSQTFVPTVFLLDEIDGAEDFKGIENCIKNTSNPLVLICNELHKIPKNVSQLCEIIRFYAPYKTDVVEAIKRISASTGKRANYAGISGDIRNSIINAFYGSEKYQTTTIYDELDLYFKKQDVSHLTPDHFAWLLDNATFQLSGKAKYTFYQMLSVCDQLNSFTPLKISQFKGKEKIEYPRFIRKIQIYKKGK